MGERKVGSENIFYPNNIYIREIFVCFMFNKRGQITLFVIIAIVIVAGIVIAFAVWQGWVFSGGGSEFGEVYDFFDSCVETKVMQGLKIAGSQAGYIEVPEFSPGSEYAPFSSQLDFLGNPVPYWYYVSGNGVVKEQVPSKTSIERQLEDYLDEQLENCDFSSFREGGRDIDSDAPSSDVRILDSEVRVRVDMDLGVIQGEDAELRRSHEVSVDSDFGEMYGIAVEIYEKEVEDAFLENYAIDVMYNYAPVTGSELSCRPLTWNPEEVVSEIKGGLSANTGFLKTEGNYYSIENKEEEYFVVEGLSSDIPVNFMYNPSWPTRVEVWPAENGLLVAEPVGLDEGLGILGFCYVPYHFVYDIYYPTLIQVNNGEELFQFPVAVVIDNSVPREAIASVGIQQEPLEELCNYRNTEFDVYTYDNQLRDIEADVDFICLNQRCNMGSTSVSGSDAVLSVEFPQCVNGRVVARAEGYVPGEKFVSTNSEGSTEIILDRLYEMDLEVVVGGLDLVDRGEGGVGVITFESEKYRTSVAYPEQESVELAEGLYNISVRVFSGSDLRIPASSRRECVEVPVAGLFGAFGQTTEECFNVDISAQTLDNALSAGGKRVEFVLEDDLRNSNSVRLSVDLLPSPTSLQQLQQNFELVENQNLGVTFE